MTSINAVIEGQDSRLDKKYKLWRIRAFLGTWLAYAGFYICRKTIAVAQPEYMKEFSWTEMDVGIVLSGYLWAYAIGQFVNGVLGDKVGTRRMFAIGLCITILMNLLFGFSFSILMMFFLWTINGYAQSCGWPSAVKGMSNWFSVRERGKIMGPWGTCYTVGDVVGTGLAAFVIGHVATNSVTGANGEIVTFSDWRWVFWVAALVLVILVVIVFMLFRNKPEDVGLPDITVYHGETSQDKNSSTASLETQDTNIWENTKVILRKGPIWILGATYFGIKFIRYTFMFWMVTYLVREKSFTTEVAAYTSTLFGLVGILGAISASYLSDIFFNSRRAPISVIMLLGLTGALFFFYNAPTPLIPIAIGLIGFMTYGPDFVVSAVAVMDFGSRKGAGTAAGFVNGMGSIGAATMPLVVGWMATNVGWNSVFYLLIGFSLVCAALMATLWNKVGTN